MYFLYRWSHLILFSWISRTICTQKAASRAISLYKLSNAAVNPHTVPTVKRKGALQVERKRCGIQPAPSRPPGILGGQSVYSKPCTGSSGLSRMRPGDRHSEDYKLRQREAQCPRHGTRQCRSLPSSPGRSSPGGHPRSR